MRKPILTICIALSLILFSQKAMAGTRVYVSFGFPVVQFEMYGGDPCEDSIWIEGHYYLEQSRYVWVPGYWVPIRHNHNVCIQRPPVYNHFHGNPHQIIYRNSPRGPYGHYNGDGQNVYGNNGRADYNHQQNSTHPQYNTGQGNYNHQQNQYDNQRHDGYRSNGNWMNNINNKIIKRQINHAQ